MDIVRDGGRQVGITDLGANVAPDQIQIDGGGTNVCDDDLDYFEAGRQILGVRRGPPNEK
jgi:hypothetical protein